MAQYAVFMARPGSAGIRAIAGQGISFRTAAHVRKAMPPPKTEYLIRCKTRDLFAWS
jgi:hypothetical protein